MAVFRFFKMAAPSYWDCVTPLEKDRATALGNIRKKFRKDRACAYGSGDILADRQTDTQTCSLQHYATAPADEVIVIILSV